MCVGVKTYMWKASSPLNELDLSIQEGRSFKASSALVCSSDFGVPSHRPRRYTLFTNVETVDFQEDWSRDALSSLFRRNCLSSAVYRLASPDDVARHSSLVADSRKLAVTPAEVRTWPSVAFLTQGEAERLEEYIRVAVATMQEESTSQESKVLLWDLSQHMQFAGRGARSAEQKVPTLLRSSRLWWQDFGNPSASRLATVEEYFAIQSMPVLLSDIHDFRDVFPFPSVLPALSVAEGIGWAGNAMNLAVVGTLLLFALSAIDVV